MPSAISDSPSAASRPLSESMPSASAAAAIARPISLTASPRSWRPFTSRNADSTGIRISATTLLATSSWPAREARNMPAIEVVRADRRDERADVGGLLRGLERRGAADGVGDRLVRLELAEGPEGLGAVEVVHAGGDVGGTLGGQRDGLAGCGPGRVDELGAGLEVLGPHLECCV